MPVFTQTGSTFRVGNDSDLKVYDALPPGNYLVQFNPFTGFYLEEMDSFKQPERVYGDKTEHEERILRTFFDRPGNTGAMFTGDKGSGKTLLARGLAINLESQGHPCLVVNEPYHGDQFNSFLSEITQPCMVLFDEFEKVYDKEAQQAVLTLFDGVFQSRKLFVITCNDKFAINSYMVNRPGRVYYNISFSGLDEAFVREYCSDVLLDQSQTDLIARLAVLYRPFTFDMLQSVVEEHNRFGGSVMKNLEILNVAESGLATEWTLDSISKEDTWLPCHLPSFGTFSMDPFDNNKLFYHEREHLINHLAGLSANERSALGYGDDDWIDDIYETDDAKWRNWRFELTPDNVVEYNENTLKYLDPASGCTIVFTPRKTTKYTGGIYNGLY